MSAMTLNGTGIGNGEEGEKRHGNGSDSPLSSIFAGLRNSSANIRPLDSPALEYLFDDEYRYAGPSWGARICYNTGSIYLAGLMVGGLWGLGDGLRNPIGHSSSRLRINCILNACTARGPFVANSLAIVSLLYNLVHGGMIKARDGKEDAAGSAGSAALAAVIFKSTAGLKRAGLAGAAFGSTMLAYQLCRRHGPLI